MKITYVKQWNTGKSLEALIEGTVGKTEFHLRISDGRVIEILKRETKMTSLIKTYGEIKGKLKCLSNVIVGGKVATPHNYW